MDKNQLTGLILIFALVAVYFYFFAPTPAVEDERVKDEKPETKIENTIPESIPSQEIISESDSLKDILYHDKFGILAKSAEGEEKEVVMENKDLRVTFSSRGGRIKELMLKGYLSYDKKPLVLLDENSSEIHTVFTLHQREIDLADLYFDCARKHIEVFDGKTDSVVFTIEIDSSRYIQQTYTLKGKGFEIGYDITFVGFAQGDQGDMVSINWVNRLKRLEKDIKESRNKTTINYFTATESFEDVSAGSGEKEVEAPEEAVKWFAMKQKFFSSAMIAAQRFEKGVFTTSYDPLDTNTVKLSEASVYIPMAAISTSSKDITYYFGPNNYQVLKKVTKGFDKNIYLGWNIISWVNKLLIIPIFNFLDQYIGNYGIIIIILVLIVKILLFPLSYRSYLSMAKMKVLKPELDEIKEKVGNDMQKVQKEQMDLYRKVGVNPLSGCVPMILQMPILFSMFYFFPNSIELRQEAFLWASDLSTYDAIVSWNTQIPLISATYGNHVSLFTLLMTLSTILYTWSNNQVSTAQGPMKSFTYIMPVVFMFVLNSFPAGLSFYYFVSNIVTFGQQALIRRFVNEDKIKKALEENRKRNANKKKSKFQLRLDEAMKAAQENKKPGRGKKR